MDWTIAVFILIGSLLGIQLGVAAVKTATEIRIKVLFAILLFCVAVSVFFKQIELTIVGSYLVVSGALVLCLIILWPVGRDFFVRVLLKKKRALFSEHNPDKITKR